jgi:DNA modification methylase
MLAEGVPYRVINGDCADVLRKIPKESVSIVLTSPPYTHETNSIRKSDHYQDTYDFDAVAQGLFDCLEPSGILIWNEGDPTIKGGPKAGSKSLNPERHLLAFEELGFLVLDKLIWDKGTSQFHFEHRHGNAYESIYVLVKPPFIKERVKVLRDRINRYAGHKTRTNFTSRDGIAKNKGDKGERYSETGLRTDVYGTLGGDTHVYSPGFNKSYSKDYQKGHGGVMHHRLVHDLLRTYGNSVNGKPLVLLDPFAGTGTTLAEGLKLGMRVVGIEWSPKNCGVIKRLITDTILESHLNIALPDSKESVMEKPTFDQTSLPMLVPPSVDFFQRAISVKAPIGSVRVQDTFAVTPKHRVLQSHELSALGEVETKWLVEGLIPDSGVVLLGAPPKSGKSHHAINLALAVSKGALVYGKLQCGQGKVLYVNADTSNKGKTAFGGRFNKWCRGNGIDPSQPNPNWVSTPDDFRLNLKEESGFGILDELITENKPKLVVLDTLAAVSKHNDQYGVHVAIIFQTLRELALKHQVAILVLNHAGRKGKQVGSNQKEAACEVVLSLEGRKNGNSVLSVSNNRHGRNEDWEVQVQLHDHDGKFWFEVIEDQPESVLSQVILSHLGSEWMRTKDLLSKIGSAFPSSQVREELALLELNKRIERTEIARAKGEGQGRRHHAYRVNPCIP